jgi:ParB family chromosome partitioning protein
MEQVKLSDIIVKSEYLRVDTDITKLKASLESVGILNPVVVNKNNELRAGARRFTAAGELGWTEIPVTRVDKGELLEELISIDENLVRLDLNKMEYESALRRAKEIYEKLSPEAINDDLKLSDDELEELEATLGNEKKQSFVSMTAEKTGLSKTSIRSAIKRDAKSSNTIKEMRKHGELSASQTNELVKLEPEEQDQLVTHIQHRPVREIKEIIKKIKNEGLDRGVDLANTMETLPKEFSQLRAFTNKMNKTIGKILAEDIKYDGDDAEKIYRQVQLLKDNLEDFLQGGRVEPSVDEYAHTPTQEEETHTVM